MQMYYMGRCPAIRYKYINPPDVCGECARPSIAAPHWSILNRREIVASSILSLLSFDSSSAAFGLSFVNRSLRAVEVIASAAVFTSLGQRKWGRKGGSLPFVRAGHGFKTLSYVSATAAIASGNVSHLGRRVRNFTGSVCQGWSQKHLGLRPLCGEFQSAYVKRATKNAG